jgi:hypothetical protein
MPSATTTSFNHLADGDPVTLRFSPMSAADDRETVDVPYLYQSHNDRLLALALSPETGRLDYFIWDDDFECWAAEQGATRVDVVV